MTTIGLFNGTSENIDPFDIFAGWMKEAEASEPNDPNAFALASCDASGLPNLRMVLLKSHDERGFVFYTNLESAKGQELAANPRAAMLFHWKSLRRQIRVRGNVSPVSNEQADEYFASRARDSRIGAWASKQSHPLESRFALEKRVAGFAAKFNIGPVPRPENWSGFRISPLEMEFWKDGAFRLHDRIVFRREDEKAEWKSTRLYP
ncbi:MAG TPA: pyridoxamine 5'-phosphate oxidase [Rhizobiales bacterium]|nr:pyridoxamine 5'-phosphate oxidase [Hyphomicrobiales bacterium]